MAILTSSVAGIVSGRNPLEYSASSPYTLFLFQAIFITCLCQLLHYPLRKLQQPKVIAEVVCGILLGPTVMGRIPNFTETCFPPASLVGLKLFANIGIILFLFIVGLEVDLKYIKNNAKVALSVGLINMAIPFGLGCGIAKGLYNEYRTGPSNDMPEIRFTTYMVFIAVAMCITAFPVLARILVELNLIGDRVGTIVLSAGIINDLTGWILLALVVTLTNAESGVNTVYILLLTLAWFLLLVFPVRLALRYYLGKFTSDLNSGEPSQTLMVLIVTLVFISAFYTDIVGVHPIFGAFMVGVVVPRDNGYVIRITEKLEDIVHIVMIPLYFAIAGLNVNLGDLNRGIDWAYTIGIILLAMFGKVAGGLLGAKINGLFWRESLGVGVLMSCKGIVEIVVLNVGLSAGIISSRVYSMFIVMTLVTTFLTTPLAIWVYPPSYREQVARRLGTDKGEGDSEDKLLGHSTELSIESLPRFGLSGIALLLRKIDTIPLLMFLLKDLSEENSEIRAIHLREFTSRTSHLLEASSALEAPEHISNQQEQVNSTSILAIVKAFSSVLHLKFSSKSILAPVRNYAVAINDQISSPSSLLLTSVTAASLLASAEEDEAIETSTKYLFDNCKSHVALLVTTQFMRSERPITIHCVLNHDNLLSATDLLCLYLVSQLAKVHPHVRIYVRSALDGSREFESQFCEFIRTSGPDVELNVSYFREFAELTTNQKDDEYRGDLFLISHDFTETEPLDMEFLRFSLRDSFDTLVVKACV